MNANRIVLFFAAALVGVTAMVSCSEEEETVIEFPNWRETNETFFENLSDSVIELIEADEDCGWKRIKNWSYPVVEDGYEGENTDYIIVEVLDEATDTTAGMPVYTDTVEVHYIGRLLPSTSYENGYLFAYSYYLPFDRETALPETFAIDELTDGFATAVMNMHIGDNWKVYVPHELGYGSSGYSSAGIPSYSTLIFTIELVDFWEIEM